MYADESPHFEEDLSISTKTTAKILSTLFSDIHHRTSTSRSSYTPNVSDCSIVGDDQVKTPSLTRSDVGGSVEESPIIGYFHPGDDRRRAPKTPRSTEEMSNIIDSTVETNTTPSSNALIDGLNNSYVES